MRRNALKQMRWLERAIAGELTASDEPLPVEPGRVEAADAGEEPAVELEVTRSTAAAVRAPLGDDSMITTMRRPKSNAPPSVTSQRPRQRDATPPLGAAHAQAIDFGDGELPNTVSYPGRIKEPPTLRGPRSIGPLPVAVYGMGLSLVLLVLALAWIRTDRPALLDLHYGLSLIGVIFEVYFLSLQIFVIGAVCIWCTLYGLSLVARFFVAMAIWLRRGRLSERFRT